MRMRYGNLILSAVAAASILVAPIANAYAVTDTSTSFSWRGAWDEISAPFQNFVDTLQGVSSNSVPVMPNNPADVQPIPPIQNAITTAVTNAASVVLGWLSGLANQLANWILSLVK